MRGYHLKVWKYEDGSPSFSQYGEDALLVRLLQSRRKGTCVEIGAYDGHTFSMTYLLEKKGWQCVLVEPMADCAAKIRAERNARVFECAVGSSEGQTTLLQAEGVRMLSTISRRPEEVERIRRANSDIRETLVPLRTIDSILQECGPLKLDFVSIDVEGTEEDALRGFDVQRWRPRILIVEDKNEGRSGTVPQMLSRHGYTRFLSTGCNDWYASRSSLLRYGLHAWWHVGRMRIRNLIWKITDYFRAVCIF